MLLWDTKKTLRCCGVENILTWEEDKRADMRSGFHFSFEQNTMNKRFPTSTVVIFQMSPHDFYSALFCCTTGACQGGGVHYLQKQSWTMNVYNSCVYGGAEL